MCSSHSVPQSTASQPLRLHSIPSRQFVVSGPLGAGGAIYTGATKDINNAPIVPTTLETQGGLNQLGYSLDTTCSTIGSFATFGARIYQWTNKIQTVSGVGCAVCAHAHAHAHIPTPSLRHTTHSPVHTHPIHTHIHARTHSLSRHHRA